MVDQELMPDPVQLIGGDSRCDVPADLRQRLGREAARGPHPLDRARVLDVRLTRPRAFLAYIFRLGDVRRHLPGG
jgi:hypothetical protein